ncbi:MAG TPA: SDR family NAD(P)-dependent oxidoreductase, partial [Nevskiaceae bacterium]|nr:SDR family NAD(P)-dependent oxidoreductase [Nevskiaceae bacterium]
MRLDGCAAVVTGGHSGMGYAAARMLGEAGCRVAILGRRRAVVEEKGRALGALPLVADIADADAVAAAFEAAQA